MGAQFRGVPLLRNDGNGIPRKAPELSWRAGNGCMMAEKITDDHPCLQGDGLGLWSLDYETRGYRRTTPDGQKQRLSFPIYPHGIASLLDGSTYRLFIEDEDSECTAVG